MELNKIIHGDCFEVLKDYPDNFFDAVITDPPYGIGLDKWDVKIDISLFTSEVYRLLDTGFYCFFGQMPTVIDWINEAHKILKYKDQIVWVKRRITICNGLCRSYENIFVYCTHNHSYFKTKGKYEDVKIEGVYFDVVSIESIKRYVSDLHNRIENNKEKNIVKINKKAGQELYRTRRFESERSPRMTNFTNVWSFLSYISQANKHPTAKPLELIKRLIELTTPENGIVLDPFAGSFTTAIACLETGRKYVCIEKEKDYFEIGKNRIEQWHLDKELEANKDRQLQLDVI